MPSIDEAMTVLDGLLDVERNALRQGNFADLSALIAEKTRLTALIESEADASVGLLLAGIRAKADGNQRLLESAIKGVRSAQRRVEAIRQAHRSLTTYDCRGRATTIISPGGTIEKRA